MTVFETIKNLAKSHSKTMKQVTLDLNYSENYFYTLKNGKQPSAEKLNEIADYFGVSVDYLLGRTNHLEISSASIDTLSKIYKGEDKKYIELLDKIQQLDEDEIESVINIIDVMIKKK